MKRPGKDQVRFLLSNRAFIQFNGARPNELTRYYGQDTNYMIVQGVTMARKGAVTTHWAGDPFQAGSGNFQSLGRTVGTPPNPGGTLHVLEKRGALNRMFQEDCPFTVYVASGDCGDISDLVSGWSDFIEVYPDSIMGSINAGNRGVWSDDNLIIDQIPFTPREIYQVGAMGFGSVGASQATVEIAGVVYGSLQRCGSCGPSNNGTLWQYAAQISNGIYDLGNVLYSVDGGLTWTALAITGIGTGADPTAIAVVGDKLLVLVTSENAYYYTTINQATGVPSSSWSKVTTGFVALKTPTDILVYNPREVYFSANGGYIYKSTDITGGVSVLTAGGATTENLNRLDGKDETIVAVGANGTVLVSSNRGFSWSLTDTEPGTNPTLQGVDVRDGSRFWTVSAAGELFYSLDGGDTWTEKELAGAPTDLRDVRFVNDEQGWVVGGDGTDGAIYWTPNGGRDWTTPNAAPRMKNMPTSNFVRGNRVAFPDVTNANVAANNLLVGGLGDATDGVILLGVGNVF